MSTYTEFLKRFYNCRGENLDELIINHKENGFIFWNWLNLAKYLDSDSEIILEAQTWKGTSVASRLSKLDKYEKQKKPYYKWVCMHRIIICLSKLYVPNKRIYNLYDMYNSSYDELEKLEKLISADSELKWNELDISETDKYWFLLNVLFNSIGYLPSVFLVQTRKISPNFVLKNEFIPCYIIYNCKMLNGKLTKGMYDEVLKNGWNMVLNISPIKLHHQVHAIKLTPVFNTNWKNCIINKLNYKDFIEDISPSDNTIVKVINKINKIKNYVDKENVEFIKKYTKSDNFYNFLHNNENHESILFHLDKLPYFYFEHNLDRRGRINYKNYPISPQHMKLVRFLVKGTGFCYKESKSYNFKWKIKIPDILNIEIEDEHMIRIYYELLVKLVYYIEKPTIDNDDSDLIEKHKNWLLNLLSNYDTLPNEEDHSKIQIKNILDSINSIKSNKIPTKMIECDANGSVYQMYAILTASNNPTLLNITGLCPDKNWGTNNMYDEILEKLKIKSPAKYLKYLDRKVIKAAAMPLPYGLTMIGLKNSLKNMINENDLIGFSKWLYNSVKQELENCGIELKKYKLAVDDSYKKIGHELHWYSASGMPVYLEKTKTDLLSKTIQRSEHTIIIPHIDKDIRLAGKFTKQIVYQIPDKNASKQGLFVGIIHSCDASVLHILINDWPFDDTILCIHDAVVVPAYLLPILREEYAKSLIKFANILHNNHPFKQIIDLEKNQYKKLDKLKKVNEEIENRKNNFLKCLEKINIRRVFY